MKIRKIVYLLALSVVLSGLMVSCSSSSNVGVELKSFKVVPLTVKAGETVTVSWELTGTGPFTVLLNNIDVSDKEFMTFEPTRTTNYRLVVEDPWIKLAAVTRRVTVEP